MYNHSSKWISFLFPMTFTCKFRQAKVWQVLHHPVHVVLEVSSGTSTPNTSFWRTIVHDGTSIFISAWATSPAPPAVGLEIMFHAHPMRKFMRKYLTSAQNTSSPFDNWRWFACVISWIFKRFNFLPNKAIRPVKMHSDIYKNFSLFSCLVIFLLPIPTSTRQEKSMTQ